MRGLLTIDGIELEVTAAELHIPVVWDARCMFLAVHGNKDNNTGSSALWRIDLPLLGSLDDLDGQRIHVHANGDCFPDDTLDTNIFGQSDLTYWELATDDANDKGGAYVVGAMRLDFERIEAWLYRCRLWCSLMRAPERELPPLIEEDGFLVRAPYAPDEERGEPMDEDFDREGSADFLVEVDEANPYG